MKTSLIITSLTLVLTVLIMISFFQSAADTSKEYARMENLINELEDVLEEKQKITDRLADLNAILKTEKEEALSNVEKMRKENKSLKNTLQELEGEIEGLKKEIEHLENIKVFSMEATAYTDDYESQGKWVGQTATGRKPRVGIVAVDPKVIPLGTRLYVEGYGPAIAGDTGGAIEGHRIDLFMASRGEALRFGRRQIRVRILD